MVYVLIIIVSNVNIL
jgi:cysteinyl-tRNA synthetase